jgi:pyruvate/2-oxoacid:ferredoxin oxidoreductase beta subunit
MKLTAMLLVLTLVTGCATSGSGNNCSGWKPIYLDTASVDGLTERDAGAILGHNLYGESRKCW